MPPAARAAILEGMTAAATTGTEPGTEPDTEPDTEPGAEGARLSPELADTLLEIAASERALDNLLLRSSRLHESRLAHDPRSCLVCFGER